MINRIKPYRGISLNKSHQLSRGLVGCWLFNENSGAYAFDSSGNGNHFTTVSGHSWGGGGLALSGSNQVEANSCNGLTASCTYEVLAYCPDWVTASVQALIELSDNSTNNRIVLYVSSVNSLLVYQKGGGSGANAWSYTTPSFLIDGQTHHFVVYSEPSTDTHNVYVDGVLITPTATITSGGVPTGLNTVNIGTYYDLTSDFTGIVYKSSVYNRKLTASEIYQLYRDPYCMFRQADYTPYFYTEESPAGSLGFMLMMDHFNGGYLHG